jgi:NAD(P)-dependent dehydrogenase (short-subunit alcohol dehydrogenase family)
MDLGVRDKLYIIVGGTRGMGHAAARVLAEDGARLALFGRTQATAEEAAASIRGDFGGEVEGYGADASAKDGKFEAMVAEIITKRGTPRGLLVTSGVGYDVGTLLDITDAQWEAAYQDVLMCHVRASRAVIPAMIDAGGGQIVTTSAYSARAPKSFLFGYSDQKAAVANFTKNIAKTYGPQGIRANSVCPGAFETQVVADSIQNIMAEKGVPYKEAAAELLEVNYKMPVGLRRPGKAEEAGDLMAFLLSERGGYLNGAMINIDGGTDF